MKRILLCIALLCSAVNAQVSYTGLEYVETFDGMGAAGTTPPAGWSFLGALGGGNGTWTNATGIPAASIGGGTLNNTLTATTSFSVSSNTSGYNFALAASPADRALGSSPTSGQGVIWQLALVNNSGSAVGTIRLGYDIRRFTASTTANQLPGYWLFVSTDGGSTWSNVGALNPALSSAAVNVPNTTGITSVSNAVIPLPSPWTTGATLLLRWVDDNAAETSPDQVLGIDNVRLSQPAGQPPTVSLTAPSDGSVFIVGDTINFAATTADTDGTIAKVAFFDDSALLGEDSSAPFGFAWSGATSGTHVLTARATDNDGNVTTSTAVSVIVNATAGSGTLTRGPYLQKAGPARMTIRWRSSQIVIGRVRYGTSAGSLNQIADETAGTTEHVVELTGLTAGTTYFYSVGSAADTPAGGIDFTFTTPPAAGTPANTRIWVLGDAGTANSNQTAVRDAFYAWTAPRTPDLVLQLGDNAYNTGTDAEFQAAVFDMYAAMLRKTPFWSCLGNHETAQATAFVDTYPYFDLYTFPTAGECGGVASGTEHYFSFDHGNIHFISLDSMTASRSPAGAMATWLQADLASTTATWIVCFFHHPPYTKGSHNSDSLSDSGGAMVEMRQNILPILEAGGVDLVLCGHSHCYERSYLLDGHYGSSTTLTSAMKKNAGNGREGAGNGGAYVKPLTGPRDHFGAVYAVAGSAGQISGGTLDHPAHFISLNTLGSLVLDVNGTRLDATFLRETGATPDTFTLIKQGAADSDGDGVADAFEIAHGMDRFNSADATLDTDRDGNNARAEYLFGLDPAASDRYGWATVRNPTTSHVTVSYPTLPQRTYRVLWSSDLVNWSTAAGPISGDGTSKQWTDDGSVTGSPPSATTKRFYRVEAANGP
ncbi:MAG: metallophosphoesterase [Verrucomicrobiaceae bacterium]|nr:metallophosphoesterase [Verrucomicrobiaceae bacterium]